MEYFYPLFIAFIFVFLSELGDKTQLLVLSFSTKLKTYIILLGVALGSLFSHGLAVLFGSSLGSLDNSLFHDILELVTYVLFFLFGIFSLVTMKRKKDDSACESPKNSSFLTKLNHVKMNYVFLIAFSIAIGEIGDKTFLAALGLGINYPYAKTFLVIGCILGMVISDLLAILLGKLLSKKCSPHTMELLSASIFLLFGLIGLCHFFFRIYIG